MKKQQGSAHVIVIVVLVLVVLGALGFIFWQNFVSKKSSTASVAPATAQSATKEVPVPVATMQTLTSTLSGRTIAMDYPKDWTKTETSDGTPESPETSSYTRTISVTSPSGAITIKLTLMENGGLGGACDPDSSTLTYVDHEPMKNDSDLGFIKVIEHVKFNTYGDQSDPTKATQTVDDYANYSTIYPQYRTNQKSITVGASGCDLNLYPFAKEETTEASGQNIPELTARIYINALQDSDSATEAQIKTAFATDEYKAAEAALLTLTDK